MTSWTRFAEGLDRLVGHLMRPCEILTIAVGIWLAVVLFVNVFCRFVLNFSLTWVDESSEALLAWLMLAVAPIGFHQNFHINMGVLVESAPRPIRFTVAILINLGVAWFFIIAGYFGVLSTIAEFHRPLFSVPITRGYVTWILPASSALVLLVCFNNLVKVLRLRDMPPSTGGLIE